MDNVTSSYLNSFINKMGLPIKTREENFEYFAAYTILSDNVAEALTVHDLKEIITGQGIQGIDAIAFCIQDRLILPEEDLEGYNKSRNRVDIYFFQIKTSKSFEDSELGSFLDSVLDFFADKHTKTIPNKFRVPYDFMVKNITKFPEIFLHCYYVTLGKEQQKQTTLHNTIDNKKCALKDKGLFEEVNITLVGHDKLISEYKKVINPISCEFTFTDKVAIRKTNSNIEEAFIGYLPFSEFKKLIIGENGKIKNLFNYNVREFLGLEEVVNSGIKDTIDRKDFQNFPILNNGVTIVADKNEGKSDKFVLKHYQIVNGCQTSNVLYERRLVQGIDETLIPLRIVITQDESLRDQIIMSTNSQTKIDDVQLFAITKYQGTLEDYYKTQFEHDGIYYERRTKQYANINRTQIIDIKEQIKAFMAMFLDIPYKVSGNIGKVLKEERRRTKDGRNELFQENHDPVFYYIAGLVSQKWDGVLTKDETFGEFNKFRYHVFNGFRVLVEDTPFKRSYLERKNAKKYIADKLLDTIRNEAILKDTFKSVICHIGENNCDKPKAAYSKPVYNEIIKKLHDIKNQSNNI